MSDHKFGDMILRHGARGWYAKGFYRLGCFRTLRELKEAIELAAMEAMLQQAVEAGFLERVS